MVRRQLKQHVKRCRYVGQLSRIQSEATDKSRINVRLYGNNDSNTFNGWFEICCSVAGFEFLRNL